LFRDYLVLFACNELSWTRKGARFPLQLQIKCDSIYKFIRDRGIRFAELYTSVLKITSHGKRERREEEIIYPR